MVNSVKLIGTPEHKFNYLQEDTHNKQVAELIDRLKKGIEFKPGINIIIGENGCGKSTLLDAIRHVNRIEHSFVPKKDSIRFVTVTELNEFFNCFEVKQDYRYAVFNLYHMYEDKGAVGNGNIIDTFDDAKLFLAGKEESKGQNVLGDINQLMDWMFSRSSECFPMLKFVFDAFEDFKDKKGNESSVKLKKAIAANQVDSDPPMYTIIMDEPDQGLDILNLEEVYSIISYDKPDTQLIAAIHNPVLINRLSKLPYVNIIEMSEGYLDKVKNFIEAN